MSDNFDSQNNEIINSPIENNNTEKKQEKNPKNKGMIILIVILVIAFLFSFVKDFFTKDSQIVKQQVFLVRTNRMTEDDIPDLFNLRKVVLGVLDEIESEDGNQKIKIGMDSDD